MSPIRSVQLVSIAITNLLAPDRGYLPQRAHRSPHRAPRAIGSSRCTQCISTYREVECPAQRLSALSRVLSADTPVLGTGSTVHLICSRIAHTAVRISQCSGRR